MRNSTENLKFNHLKTLQWIFACLLFAFRGSWLVVAHLHASLGSVSAQIYWLEVPESYTFWFLPLLISSELIALLFHLTPTYRFFFFSYFICQLNFRSPQIAWGLQAWMVAVRLPCVCHLLFCSAFVPCQQVFLSHLDWVVLGFESVDIFILAAWLFWPVHVEDVEKVRFECILSFLGSCTLFRNVEAKCFNSVFFF